MGPFQRGLICEFELFADIRFNAFNVMVFCENCTNVYIVAALRWEQVMLTSGLREWESVRSLIRWTELSASTWPVTPSFFRFASWLFFGFGFSYWDVVWKHKSLPLTDSFRFRFFLKNPVWMLLMWFWHVYSPPAEILNRKRNLHYQ